MPCKKRGWGIRIQDVEVEQAEVALLLEAVFEIGAGKCRFVVVRIRFQEKQIGVYRAIVDACEQGALEVSDESLLLQLRRTHVGPRRLRHRSYRLEGDARCRSFLSR